jgi:hypothetical protein
LSVATDCSGFTGSPAVSATLVRITCRVPVESVHP